MNIRSSRSVVTFARGFVLADDPAELPAGAYEVIAEEERLEGVGVEAWRRCGTYLMVQGRGRNSGRFEMRAIAHSDLIQALVRDAARAARIDGAAVRSRKETSE